MGMPALLLLGELPDAQLDGRDLLPRLSGGVRRKILTAAPSSVCVWSDVERRRIIQRQKKKNPENRFLQAEHVFLLSHGCSLGPSGHNQSSSDAAGAHGDPEAAGTG